jgi:hypothetical protein
MNDTRSERTNPRTKRKRTENENRTNDTRKRTNEKRKGCEIYVNLSYPGFVRRSQNYFSFKGLFYGD